MGARVAVLELETTVKAVGSPGICLYESFFFFLISEEQILEAAKNSDLRYQYI